MDTKQLSLDGPPEEQVKAPAKSASKSASKTPPKERLLRGALSTTRDLLQYLDLKISELETDLEALRGARQVLLKDEQRILSKRGEGGGE
jgi:hypothetical protein